MLLTQSENSFVVFKGFDNMIYLIISAVIVAADIITKIWAMNTLAEIGSIPVWDGVFRLTYIENRGAAFGILQDRRWIFILLTVLILAAVAYAAFRFRNKPRLLCLGMSFLVGGAVGNMIDRIHLGYVVDFLDFCLIDFPVFNTADIFVCVGAALCAVYFIIFDKSDKEGSEKNDN